MIVFEWCLYSFLSEYQGYVGKGFKVSVIWFKVWVMGIKVVWQYTQYKERVICGVCMGTAWAKRAVLPLHGYTVNLKVESKLTEP